VHAYAGPLLLASAMLLASYAVELTRFHRFAS
jgi:hypothetical protein